MRDNIEKMMNPVTEIHICYASRPEHDRRSCGMPTTIRMRSTVRNTLISLCLNDPAGRSDSVESRYEYFADKFPGDLLYVSTTIKLDTYFFQYENFTSIKNGKFE